MTATAAEVTIDHLHARYDGFGRADTRRLDQALARLVDRQLDVALAVHPVSEQFAVCIPSLELVVEIEPSPDADALARQWAAQLAEQIAAVVTEATSKATSKATRPLGAVIGPWSSSGSASLDGVVVYRREIDVVADIVASVAGGDRGRLWAWNQTGVWPSSSWPTPDHIAGLLARRPTMAPLVLRSLPPDDVPLSPAGWSAVAAAVAGAMGAGLPAATAGVRTDMPGERIRSWASHVAARLPRAVCRAATPDQRAVLAVLAISEQHPALARGAEAVLAVAAAMGGVGTGTRGPGAGRRPVPDDGRVGIDEAADHGPARAGGAGRTPGTPRPDQLRAVAGGAEVDGGAEVAGSSTSHPDGTSSPSDGGDGGAVDVCARRPGSVHRLTTGFGGVAFLIGAFGALGVVDAVLDAVAASIAASVPDSPAPTGIDEPAAVAAVLARIVVGVTGVAADDPMVELVSGGPVGSDDGMLAVAAGRFPRLIEEQIDRTTAWLHDRLGAGRGIDDPVDFHTVWRRPASIDRQPGWIEIEFRLASVETRIRAARLDLDPGFVWWLGAVVRFLYV